MQKEQEKLTHPCQKSIEQQADHPVSRRRFVSAVTAATAGLVAAACSKSNPVSSGDRGSLNKSPVAPPSGKPGSGTLQSSATVATARLDNYDRKMLKDTIQASIEKLGGLSDICKTGDTVGIKLNMTGGEGSAKKAERDFGLSATEIYWTHPEILRAVGELFKDAGAGRIIVVEAHYDTESYVRWGYRDVVQSLGAEYYGLNQKSPYGDFVKVDVPNPLTHWDHYYHNGVLYDFDCFVSLPKTKRHYGAGITNAMKNMIGSVPLSIYQLSGAWRAKLHSVDANQDTNSYEGFKNLVRTIVDLNKIRPIHFTIGDAIKTADNGEGPWNQGFEPIEYNTLITSKDPVAADAIGTQIMGWDPMAGDRRGPFSNSSLPGNWAGTDNYLRIAEEEGLGYHDLSKINVIDASLDTRVVVKG